MADSNRKSAASWKIEILRAIPVYPACCRLEDLCEETGFRTKDVYQLIKKCPSSALFAELMNPDGSVIYCYPDQRCKDRTLAESMGGHDGAVSET